MDTTFKESAFTPKLGKVKPINIFSHERRRTNEKTVTDLVEALARDGRFLQQIAVRDEGAPGYLLIFGANRLEAWKRHFGEQTPIPADIYPADTPDALIAAHQFEENDFRKELTKAERKAGLLRYAAARQELEGEKPVTQVSGSGQGAKSGTMSPSLPPARGGRGNKGMAQKIAEKLSISKRSVNRDVEAASFVIGEEIDLDRDTPEELERKAAELERKAAERPEHRKPARRGAIDILTRLVKPQAGNIGGRIEGTLKVLNAMSRAARLRIVYYTCIGLGLDPLKMAPLEAFRLADEEPELDENAPAAVAPATDDAAVVQAEPGDDGADLGAEDLQVADHTYEDADDPSHDVHDDAAEDSDGHAFDDVSAATDDHACDGADDVSEHAGQEDLGAQDLQDAGVGVSKAADQKPAGATKCAYCNINFEIGDQLEEFNGKLYHGFCVEDGKRLAKAKQGKQIAIAA